MVLCSPQVDSSFALDGTPVTEIPFRNILGANQQTYERLKMALNLNLRRQIFIAVCDDLPLRDRFAVQLQSELAHVSVLTSASLTAEPRAIPKLVTLDLNLLDPNPLAQVAEWLNHVPKGRTGRPAVTPAFQVLGIERLTRQSAAIQSIFLSYLQNIEQQLPLIESCLLLWMTQPWFRMLPEAVPEFWHCRTGVFEFIGDPTPLPVTSPERIQLDPPGSLGQSRDLSSPPQPLDNLDRSAASLIENPWIPLAKDLNLYEPDPNTDPYRNVATNSELVTLDREQPNFDPWMIASGQAPQPLSAQEQALSELKQALSELKENGQSYAALSVTLQPFVDTNLVDAQPELESLNPDQTSLNGTSVDQTNQDQALNAAIFDLDLNLLTQEVAEIGQTIPLLQHIESLQQQIESLHQGQESPVVLANAYRTLGNFYRDCIEQGEASVENLTLAIQAYEHALQWLPENPLERAEIFNDLGNLYWMIAQLHSSTEDATVFLQQTVQVYQLALQNIEPQQQLQLYAMVQNNLGATYADLARYQDPAVNLQLSIDAYQRALQHRAAELDILRYASTQNNLGTTYWNLAQHQQPAVNLKHAIAAYSEAIRCYIPEQDPLNYAMIQNNLGTAYWNLAQYGQTQENLTLALTAYQNALRYRTLETAPAGFAATQNNLGTAFWHLANHSQQPTERLSYLQQAIAAYEAALQAATYIQKHQPETATLNFDLASTQNNLGLAHFQIATDAHIHLSAVDVAFHLERALKHHILALQSWETQPELRQTALSCILQTIRACYQQQGISGQNQALSQVPSQLLAEILPKL